MGPYSLPSVGNIGGTDSSTLNADGSTLAWLDQPNQQNSSGTLPGTTVINVGNVIQINGNQDYILVSDPNSGIPQLIMGLLPDGTYGMVVSKPGVDVLSVFS